MEFSLSFHDLWSAESYVLFSVMCSAARIPNVWQTNLVLEFVQGRALQMLRLLSSKMLSSVERSILFLHMRLRRRVGLEPPPPVAAAGSRGHLSFEFGSPLRAQAPPGMSVRAPSISGIVAPTARVPASPFPLPRSGGGGKGQTPAAA